MNLAIDFDGTVVRDNYPLIGPELPGAIQTLKELQSQGHKLILWTCRAHDQKLLNEAIAWCTERGLTFDGVAPGKISAYFYIDDKSIDWLNDPQSLDTKWERIKETVERAEIMRRRG